MEISLVTNAFTFWLFDNVQYSFNTTRPIPLFLHHVLYIMGYMYSPLRETRRLQDAQLHRLTLQLICRNFMRCALAEAFRVVQLCVFLLSALTSSLTCSLNAQASFFLAPPLSLSLSLSLSRPAESPSLFYQNVHVLIYFNTHSLLSMQFYMLTYTLKFLYPSTVTIYIVFSVYNKIHTTLSIKSIREYRHILIINIYLFLLYNKQYVYMEFGVGRTVKIDLHYFFHSELMCTH